MSMGFGDVKQCADEQDGYAVFFEALVERFGKPAFNSWMSDIHVERASDEDVELSTTSRFRLEKLQQQYKPGIQAAWRRSIGPARRISIIVRQHAELSRQARRVSEAGAAQTGMTQTGMTQTGMAQTGGLAGGAGAGNGRPRLGLGDLAGVVDAGCTFDAYAVARTNRLAFAAAERVFAEGVRNNAVYIYGPSGVGKTHLLSAIAVEGARRFGEGRCAYLTHANLSAGWVDAAMSNYARELHREFLTQNIILLDDVHMLIGKRRTQQEVVNLIDAFVSSGRKIVLTGSAAPGRLAEVGLNARLADYLQGGLAVPIEPADHELRINVLSKRFEREAGGCTLDDGVLDFMATHFAGSMREAIGALNQILLLFAGEDRVVSLEDAKSALLPRLKDARRPGTMEDGVQAAAEAFGITVEDIKGRVQRQFVVKARHAFVFVARTYLKESFPRIAGVIGRDHTTAMSSFRRAEALIERNQDFREAVEKIKIAVGA